MQTLGRTRRAPKNGQKPCFYPSLDTMPPGALLINVFFGTHTHTRTHTKNEDQPYSALRGAPGAPKSGLFWGPKKPFFRPRGAHFPGGNKRWHGFLTQQYNELMHKHINIQAARIQAKKQPSSTRPRERVLFFYPLFPLIRQGAEIPLLLFNRTNDKAQTYKRL